MQDVTSLFQELALLKVHLSVDQGQLRLSAAKGVLTEALRQRIVESKDELVRLLQGIQASDPLPHAYLVAQQEDGRPFPMSDLQLGFFVANDPHMEFHVRPHCYMEFDYRDFDPEAYENAWNRALQRHRRELCTVTADAQLQIIPEVPHLRIARHDLRKHDAAATNAALLHLRSQMERQELSLDVWPWFELCVSLRRDVDGDVARVHYNHNNYFIDGYGTTQLLTEVDEYYVARNEIAARAPLQLSYRDAVLGLEQLAASAAGVRARDYWFERIPGLPAPPNLPLRSGINRRARSCLMRRDGYLDAATWSAFKVSAGVHGVTPSNALICAYAHVLANWSNSDHFILSQMATRRLPELHPDLLRMLGNFVSLYPLEIHVKATQPFLHNARELQAQVLQDMRHLQIGGMRVLQELNRLKGSFGSAPSPFVVGSGLFLKQVKPAVHVVLETCQTLLDHQFFELDDGRLHFVWDVFEDYFPAGVVTAMWQAYSVLLSRLAQSADGWLIAYAALAPATDLHERRQCNERAQGKQPHECLHSALARQAIARPRAVALRHEGVDVAYTTLERESATIAARLVAVGVRRGDRVAIAMTRGASLLSAVFGVLRVGAAYVPIEPSLPRGRISLLLRDTQATAILVGHGVGDAIEHLPGLHVLEERVLEKVVPAEPAPATADLAGPDDLAYVIYTSGSTGKPKGVMIAHGSALNTIHDINARFGVDENDVLFGISAFNFDLSVYDLFGSVAAGARLLFPDLGLTLHPPHWVELIVAEGVTIWNSVPALLCLLLEAAQQRNETLPSLRLVLLSGDKIPLTLPEQLRQVAPNAVLISLGGATEASIWSNYFPVETISPDWTTIPYGYPLANQSWHVLDRNGFDCPAWVSGDLYVGGAGLALGYWSDPMKTAASFQPGGDSGRRLYRTGDIGRYLPGACLEWIGRGDFQIKIQGHRIELGEIEAALLEHPDIDQAVVTAPLENGERRRLIAHVVPHTGIATAAELENHLIRRLPHYMVPAAWRTWEQLPLSANGKIDRTELDHAILADAPTATPQRTPEQPANATESRLLAIWYQVLGRRDFGVDDDFFELGGQSFDAIRIFAAVREALSRSYTLAQMWESRTVRALAEEITTSEPDRNRNNAPITLVRINRAKTGNALFLVHPAGGSTMGYAALGKALSSPLLGIQAGPPEDLGVLDIPGLAETYVAELRRQHPRGPYRLGGWSTGAMIAFEMAAQMDAAGDDLVQLLLLDGPTPMPRADLTDEQLLHWFLQDLGLNLPLAAVRNLDLRGFEPAQHLRKAAVALDLHATAKITADSLLPSFLTFRALVRAGTRYQPGMIDADLVVVRVNEDIVDEFAQHPSRHEPDWGWGRHTRGRTRCVTAKGNHYSFLSQPGLSTWIAAIEEPLRDSALG